jgi:hypothetical protein
MSSVSARLLPRSGLIGAIWQVNDNVAVDFAVRGARINDHTAGEIRAGVTFAFGVGQLPGLLPRLGAATRPAGYGFGKVAREPFTRGFDE